MTRPTPKSAGARQRAAAPVELHRGDARTVVPTLGRGFARLAYIDPPFAVGTAFRARTKAGEARAAGTKAGPVAYIDRWPTFAAYLAWLDELLRAVAHALTADGTLWLHLDARAVHEAKGLLDAIFGRGAFRGEVIWVPGNGAKARRGPGFGHQTLLCYAPSDTFVWNGKDAVLRAPFAETSLSMHFKQRDAEGRAYRERTIAGKTYRYYADEGRALGTVWTDCPAMVANTPLLNETTGYPTQKPEKLLDRIVRASSHPGDTVLDPCFGSGTTLVAAAKAGRRAVGVDASRLAFETTTARLKRAAIDFRLP